MKLSTGKTERANVTLTMSPAEARFLLMMARKGLGDTMATSQPGSLHRQSLANADIEWQEVESALENIGT